MCIYYYCPDCGSQTDMEECDRSWHAQEQGPCLAAFTSHRIADCICNECCFKGEEVSETPSSPQEAESLEQTP